MSPGFYCRNDRESSLYFTQRWRVTDFRALAHLENSEHSLSVTSGRRAGTLCCAAPRARCKREKCPQRDGEQREGAVLPQEEALELCSAVLWSEKTSCR
ncbi:hypothetical protein AOLI_G00258890 [Acnodon oligacanthus]